MLECYKNLSLVLLGESQNVAHLSAWLCSCGFVLVSGCPRVHTYIPIHLYMHLCAWSFFIFRCHFFRETLDNGSCFVFLDAIITRNSSPVPYMPCLCSPYLVLPPPSFGPFSYLPCRALLVSWGALPSFM